MLSTSQSRFSLLEKVANKTRLVAVLVTGLLQQLLWMGCGKVALRVKNGTNLEKYVILLCLGNLTKLFPLGRPEWVGVIFMSEARNSQQGAGQTAVE